MSSLTNIIMTEFRASGNQAMAVMGQMTGGMGQLGRKVNEVSTNSEKLNGLWRAMGTTIRYAIAGQAVYGLTSMVGQLRQVQNQLGLISAIGTTTRGGKPGQLIEGANLNKLFNQSLVGAREALTPINEYNDAVLNLLSTVGDVPQDQLTPIVTTITQAAKLGQISAEDATKAFTTMNVAFGKPTNRNNIFKTAQEFFILTKEAPGGVAAGQQIITQLGQLAAVTRLAGGTQPDMFALILSSMRGGIPPAQAGRGLQFLLQTIGLPGQQSKGSEQALASVGIRPGVQMTAQERLGRIFAHARKLGLHGKLSGPAKAMDDAALSEMEAAGAGASDLGVSGPGAEFLGQVFRRIHALRTALALLTQTNVGQAQKDLKDMANAEAGHVSDINDMNKAWQRFRKQARLQDIAISVNTMGIQIAKAFEPILNLPAGPIHGIAGAMTSHPARVQAAAMAAVGGAALWGGGRFLGSGLRRGGAGLQAAQSLGGQTPDGTLMNPIYVRVVGDVFGSGPPAVLGGGIPSEGAKGAAKVSRVQKFARGAGQATIVLAVAEGVNEATDRKITGGKSIFDPSGWVHKPRLPDEWRKIGSWFGLGEDPDKRSSNPALARAQARWGSHWNRVVGVNREGVTGTGAGAELTLNIKIKHPDGTTELKKVHVPLNVWQNGSHPTQAGKAKGRK